jgi:hypothetical protein
VGEETGSKWQTDAEFEGGWAEKGGPELELTKKRREGGARRIWFVVRRVA